MVSSFTGHCQQGRPNGFFFCQILANCWNTMFQHCLIIFCAIIIQPRYKLRRRPLHYVRVSASVQTGLRHRKLSSPLWLQCGRLPVILCVIEIVSPLARPRDPQDLPHYLHCQLSKTPSITCQSILYLYFYTYILFKPQRLLGFYKYFFSDKPFKYIIQCSIDGR